MAAANKDERREMEFEALMAIYEDELKLSFDEENPICYRIKLKDVNADLVFHLSGKQTYMFFYMLLCLVKCLYLCWEPVTGI